MVQYKNTSLQQLLIMVIITLLVVMIASVWLQKHNKPLPFSAQVIHQQQAVSLSANKPVVAAKAPAASAPSTPTQRVDFDFYKLLAEQKATTNSATADKKIGTVSSPALKAAITPAAAIETNTNINAPYFLQMLATHDLAAAIRYKQQLSVLGYVATVQSFEHLQQLWYRVLIGPYGNKAIAQKIQQQLMQKKLTSLLVPVTHS